jgi:pimeloyl-ACP methyl ester carboxylesterase
MARFHLMWTANRPINVVLALVVLALAAPSAASAAIAAPPPDPGPKPPPGPKPQLLLFHGGSFLFDDPQFQPATAEKAGAAGFVPHFVSYPLGDLPAAIRRARDEARRLRQKFGLGRVYAYGSSAGGTLAALLSGDGLVSAAVAKAPVSDLVGWEWPLQRYGAAYWDEIGVDLAGRYRLSPLRRPAKSPLLVYQGRNDGVVPPTMNEAFAEKFEHVYLWLVGGGHTTERARPWLIDRAMHWLQQTAARQARAAERNNSLP